MMICNNMRNFQRISWRIISVKRHLCCTSSLLACPRVLKCIEQTQSPPVRVYPHSYTLCHVFTNNHKQSEAGVLQFCCRYTLQMLFLDNRSKHYWKCNSPWTLMSVCWLLGWSVGRLDVFNYPSFSLCVKWFTLYLMCSKLSVSGVLKNSFCI